MNCDDLDHVLNIENRVYSLKWTKSNFEYEINDNEFSRLYVLIIDDIIIGYAGVHIIFETASITTIAIDTAYQAKGYSKLLMDHIINEAIDNNCESIALEVRVSNTKAIKLYEKYGFVYINIRYNYYSDNNEAAYIMMKGI